MMFVIKQTFLAVIGVFLISTDAAAASNSTCGETSFTKPSGIIRYSGQNSNKHCSYKINTNSDDRIVLQWSSFSIDGEMPDCLASSVTVYIGCSKRSKVTGFCSRNTNSLPHPIYTRDSCLEIIFMSTQNKAESFTASYTTYPRDSPVSRSSYCARKTKLYAKSGVIYSPSWPKPSSSSYCEWDIKVPSDYLIKLNFMDLDIYKMYYVSSGCSYNKNKLYLKGEKSVLTTYENKKCYWGTLDPFSVSTRYYELELDYRSYSYRKSSRGFIVGYIAYRSDESAAAAKTVSTVGYIGMAIAIIVIVSCCLFFVWRRRRRAQANNARYHQAQQAPVPVSAMKPVSYGTGYTQDAAPPPYSAAIQQPAPGYQGYPSQPYPQMGAAAPYQAQAAPPYPASAAPYPASAAPYPASAAPYPASAAAYPASAAPYPPTTNAPYQTSAAPYPTDGAPYPPSGAPYPQPGAPHPDGGAQGPIVTEKQASAPPY